MNVRAAIAVLMALTCTGCLILPVPHTRLHAYGVRGQIIDTATGKPIENASIRAYYGEELEPEDGAAAKTDAAGRFTVASKRGFHGAYMLGPISQSMWPGWDATGTHRKIVIRAVGYETRTVMVEGYGRDGQAQAKIEGDYLVAGDLKLSPERH